METLDAYLEALASERPTPGGGSAATIVAALGAALVEMVARITARNPKFAAQHERARAIAGDAERLRAAALVARAGDEEAFGAVVAAQSLPRSNDAERNARDAALQAALGEAAEAPLHSAALGLEILRLAETVEGLGNRNLQSDAGCAAEFAAAAVAAAAYNVRANHPYMKDIDLVERQRVRLGELERERDAALARVRIAVEG